MENIYDKYILDMVGKRIAGDIVWSNDVFVSLRKWRETFKLSQQELAKELGVKQTVIADYERGRRQPGSVHKEIRRCPDQERRQERLQDSERACEDVQPQLPLHHGHG